MQVLSSPTREEIDKVHADGSWLAVGLLSPRNWKKIARNRILLVLVLAFSSVPLHLFYNATVFRVVVENKYTERAISVDSAEYRSIAANVSYVGLSSNTSYTNLTNGQWKSDFAQYHTMAYSELVLVFDDFTYTKKPFNASEPRPENFTLDETLYSADHAYGESHTMAELITFSNWLPQSAQIGQPDLELHVVHAFARHASSRSRIQLSSTYLLVVIVANVFKLLIMASVLVMDHGHSKYIVTIGDAAASFLKDPDPCTEGKCLLEDEKLNAEVDHSTTKPKADVESATSTTDGLAVPNSRTREWHKRTLGYYF
ncbi:hypothetical protein E8E12_004489 [Didymella heteroderae]|uniref:DUF6536 domain-containing protein n=1 Tax=Didymella heteroderae TaxID=1769908 RepID=A0A9P4WIM6_9PLEO|nr:hypothetical protein E8E12_004489 [Didymella heteroderae]